MAENGTMWKGILYKSQQNRPFLPRLRPYEYLTIVVVIEENGRSVQYTDSSLLSQPLLTHSYSIAILSKRALFHARLLGPICGHSGGGIVRGGPNQNNNRHFAREQFSRGDAS